MKTKILFGLMCCVVGQAHAETKLLNSTLLKYSNLVFSTVHATVADCETVLGIEQATYIKQQIHNRPIACATTTDDPATTRELIDENFQRTYSDWDTITDSGVIYRAREVRFNSFSTFLGIFMPEGKNVMVMFVTGDY